MSNINYSQEAQYLESLNGVCSCGVKFTEDGLRFYHQLVENGVKGIEAFRQTIAREGLYSVGQSLKNEDIRLCCANTLMNSRTYFSYYKRGQVLEDRAPNYKSVADAESAYRTKISDPEDIPAEDVPELKPLNPDVKVYGFLLDRETGQPAQINVGDYVGRPVTVRALRIRVESLPMYTGREQYIN